MKDKVVTGAVIGLLANAFKLVFNYLAFRLGLASVVFWQITAARFLEKEKINQPIAYIIGAATDLTVTSIIGVLFIYFLYFTGRDYTLVKGAGFGLTVWVMLLGALLFQAQSKLNLTTSDIIITLLAHLIYGLALAHLSKRLYKLPTQPI